MFPVDKKSVPLVRIGTLRANCYGRSTAVSISCTRPWSRPWCEGRRGGVGSRHLFLRISNASKGGDGVGAGVASFRLTPRRRRMRRPVRQTSRDDLWPP